MDPKPKTRKALNPHTLKPLPPISPRLLRLPKRNGEKEASLLERHGLGFRVLGIKGFRV